MAPVLCAAGSDLDTNLGSRALSRLIKPVEVLPDRPPCLGESGSVHPVGCISRALLARIRLDQAGVDGKSPSTREALVNAAPDDGLQQLAQDVAVAEAVVTGDSTTNPDAEYGVRLNRALFM